MEEPGPMEEVEPTEELVPMEEADMRDVRGWLYETSCVHLRRNLTLGGPFTKGPSRIFLIDV